MSADGASLELTSSARLDGSKIQLGQKAAQEQKKAERRTEELPAAPKCNVVLHDAAGDPIRDAPYEVSMPGYTDRGTSSSGTVEIPVFDDVSRCVLRWGRPVTSRPPSERGVPYEFSSEIWLRTNHADPDERASRRLHNLGYHHDDLAHAKRAFAHAEGAVSPAGEVADDAVHASLDEEFT